MKAKRKNVRGTEQSAIVSVPGLVKRLYAIVADFDNLFPGRHFTPDGHLVGSIGEVVAAYRYGLSLLSASSEAHDALTSTGKKVQIKATQGKIVGLRADPEHLLVVQLTRKGEVEEVFNGPGALAWGACGPIQRNGQRAISVSKLRALMERVPKNQRLTRVDQ